MPKLLKKEKFLDLSDYGRRPAIYLAESIKNTSVTPIHVTLLFGICGLGAVLSILNELYFTAGILLIIKSIIDAMDGELARIKATPSYSGRYLDSIFDSILNLFFLLSIGFMANESIAIILISYVCLQLQGTLYNYYYVILRHRSEGGDTTSKIFEMKSPVAFPIEKQETVNILFWIYMVLYAPFDKTVYFLDNDAYKVKAFPNWFMMLISSFGLGFQLLIMAFMLSFGFINYIIPFFIFYSVLIIVFIGIRKLIIK
jgi:phosphatidylserine synthase